MAKIKKPIKYIGLVLIAAVFLFPLIFMLASSFMSSSEISRALNFMDESFKKVKLIPDMFSAEQYYQVFFRRPEYLQRFWNSVIITLPTTLIQVVVSAMAAFAFAKLRFPLRDKLFFVYIILLILPIQVTLVPNYIVLDKLGLLNTFASVILPGAFSAFGICLLRQSITYISDSSIEAARMDGASYFMIFTRIILPQIRGGLVTLTLLTFIDSWNNIEQPMIYFSDTAMYPLSVSISDIAQNDFGVVYACGVMFLIPPILIYMYGEKDIKSPFTSADKL
ncbi:MAG: carbohydrate ABC transporter permease [Ruminococcus sp.]|nr:carbohydrate ABC transporter permease [Ruminococcus sp.]